MTEPTMYNHTNCRRLHQSWSVVAHHLWPKAQVWGANGPYTTIAPCRSMTIELHLDLASAQLTLDAMAGSGGCGGHCTPRRHEIALMQTPNPPKSDALPPWCGQCDGPTLPERWVNVPRADGRDYPPRVARCSRCNPYAK